MSKSPSPVRKIEPFEMITLHDFPDAIRALADGKRIARESWHNEDFGVLRNGEVQIQVAGEWHVWKITDGDLLGEDWIIS